jgi:hypothetical protein
MDMNFDEKLPKIPSHWNNDRLHFFKYMSFKTAKIVLENRTLRWTTPRTLNDLYDVQIDLNINVDLERLEALSYEKIWNVMSGASVMDKTSLFGPKWARLGLAKTFTSKEDFVRAFEGDVKISYDDMSAKLLELHREHLKDLKVLCLTEDPTNPPMWAHYAEHDSGVVVRLRSVPALDRPYGMALPMNYLQEIPPLFDEKHFSDVISGIRPDNHRAQLDRMIYSKGSAWSYEKEWRISAGDGSNKTEPHEDMPFGLNDLDGVMLGINMTAENRQTIIELTKSYPNVELFEAKKSTSGFHHDIVPLAS